MSASIDSTGMFRKKPIENSIPSMPSLVGRPPEPPHSGWMTLTLLCPVSRSGTRSRKIDPWPAPAAGTVSGRACASAPINTSTRRICVAERLPTATPGSGFSTLPRGMAIAIGRASPELYVMPLADRPQIADQRKHKLPVSARANATADCTIGESAGPYSEKSSVMSLPATRIRTLSRMARPPPESPFQIVPEHVRPVGNLLELFPRLLLRVVQHID